MEKSFLELSIDRDSPENVRNLPTLEFENVPNQNVDFQERQMEQQPTLDTNSEISAKFPSIWSVIDRQVNSRDVDDDDVIRML